MLQAVIRIDFPAVDGSVGNFGQAKTIQAAVTDGGENVAVPQVLLGQSLGEFLDVAEIVLITEIIPTMPADHAGQVILVIGIAGRRWIIVL